MNLGVRRFGSQVNSKVQKRRELFVRNKYPEYAGNAVSDPSSLSRRGKRLGGAFADPSRSPIKLDNSEGFYDTEDRKAIDDMFIERLRRETGDPSRLTTVVDDYKNALLDFEASKEPVSHERARKIKDITRIDYAAESRGSKPIKAVKGVGSGSARFHPIRDEGDIDVPSGGLRGAGEFWRLQNAKSFVEVHSISVPSAFSSSLREYHQAKSASVMFDESFRQTVRLSGEDCLFVLDHFTTAPVRLANIGDSLETCIVDSKGLVMSTGTVSRVAEAEFEILIDGFNDSIFRYLSQYVVYSRQSGMDVIVTPCSFSTVLSLYGPKSSEFLATTFNSLGGPEFTLGQSGDPLPSINFLRSLPPMTLCWTQALGVSILKKVDHYIIAIPTEIKDVLLKALAGSGVQCGGVYALDMLRMEQGVPRPQVDVPPASSSPLKAGMLWAVDQKKVRERVMFGHDRISQELLKGTSHRRVGLVSEKYVYGGCKLLSAPHRHPIGEITSCAWNPILKKRVCQAYVKPEYAVSGNPLLVNVPLAVPESLNFRFKRRIARQGALQNVFRKLVNARIVAFPITGDTCVHFSMQSHDPLYDSDSDDS
jgi:glycine cleavage system aminomethyltransferase T